MDLQPAIITDLDGTLALLNGRDPYKQQDLAGQDEVNHNLAFILKNFNRVQYATIVITGRWELYRSLTADWLRRNEIAYDALFMRPDSNYDSSTKMKEWYLENLIQQKWDVRLAFDDLFSICKMWRSHGISAYQVANDPYIIGET